jgi:alanyl-tRNA synthetase
LGTHVEQKGSLVNADHLRFDFSHFSKLSEKELADIERMVNEKIRENILVVIREMPRDEALKKGAMALFGEKYGETVRVVTIDPSFSIELCGGTHVSSTGQLGFFKIKSESAIAAGVRRIEAVAGPAAEDYISEEMAVLTSIRHLQKNPKDLLKSLQEMQTDTNNMRKKMEGMEMKQASLLKSELLKEIISIGKYKFLGKLIEGISAESLRNIGSDLRREIPSILVVLATIHEGKPLVVVGLGDQLASENNLDASKIVREIVAPQIKGGGGGQKTLATAGGQDSGGLTSILTEVKALL